MPSKKNKTKTQPPATVQNFPIVGIGASAGGLDAFKRLLTAIPESSGMAFVLVQHLDPSHESILPEILQRVTKIPVHEITEDIHLAPDHIYVIPSNKMLVSTDGVLKLTDRQKKINLSIDIFFTSLADVHKEFAVGVVLSGTGSDGTQGLKAIKEQGGISIAQDSESAAYDSMPQSAVNAGVVDFILAPENIPAQLLQINSAYKTSHFYKDEEELPKDDEYIFKQILLLLHQRSGVDFTYYKQPTFHRRIARRIAIVKKKNLADYLNFLRTDKAEQDALFQDVLIPVTSFFRDPKTFQTLCDTVFPVLFKNKSADEPIRVWIAGCSTGEEAFSIAICLHEFLGEKLNPPPGGRGAIQIFASDISEKAIKKARAAIYTKADVEKISAHQLKNYFVKNNGGYEVSKLIRDMCVFAPHNFLKDPPFAKMDLITCRNVLIYMDTFLQKKAFTTFHYALKENGFLLLGKSETTGASSDLFTQFSKHDKIYSRKPARGRFMHVATERREEALATKDKTKTKQETVHTDFRKSAEAIMISKSPASVVVNEQMDIVHIHGIITPFLESPQGKPTHNLLKMAREGLAFELRNTIHKATKEQAAVIKENIPVKANGKQSLVTIEIIPLTDTIEPHYLIRFEKKIIPPEAGEIKSSSGKIKTAETQKQNEQLEKELSQTREDMRSITEDMEAANEELQSANEELQSSNEEMQSLNEELETSKEELQSTNEELIIVNQELLDKQEQLNASRFYSEAIVTTMREPLVVLDKGLRVKTANASFYKKFNVDEKETENKLFYEIQNHQFDDTLLRSLLEKILPQKNRIEDFEINLRLPDKGERIILLNARQIVNEKKAEQLILLAMEDITDRVRSEKILKESEARSRALVESNVVAVCFTHMETATIFEANDAYLNMLGYTRQDLKEGKINWLNYTPPEHHVNDHVAIEKAKSMKVSPPYEKEIMRTDGKRISVIKARAVINKDEIMSVFVDITERKSAEQKLKTFAEELAAKNKLVAESEVRFKGERLVLYNSFMNAPAAIAILKGDTHIFEFANTDYEKLVGRKITLGKTAKELIPEVEQQGLLQILDNAYATGEPFIANELPVELIRKEDSILEKHYLNLVIQPLKDNKGNVERLLSHVIDVTEQVEARKQIEESEKRFSMLADSIPNLAWMAYADGNIFWYNKKWFEYTGTTLTEMQGWGWQSVHDPEELPKVLIKWRKSIETGQPFEMVFPIKGADGKFRQFLTRILPVYDSENKIYRWFGTNTDIDEEKMLTEEKFLLEFAEDFSHYKSGAEFFGSLVTYIANKTGIDYVFIGELTEKEKNTFTIKTIALTAKGKLVPNIEYPLPDGPCEQVIRGTVYSYPNQCRITFPKNQTLVQFNVDGYVGYPLFDSDGKPIGLVAVMHEKEISNPEYVAAILKIVAKRAEFEMERNKFSETLKATNTTLKTTVEELKQTNMQLDQFAHVASHDLQEPLRKIITFSMRLQDKHKDGLPAEVKTYLNKIEGASGRMRKLIQDLLNYSRLISHEKLFAQTDLNETLKNVLNDFELLIEQKEAKIKSDTLPVIEAIPLQMNQLFYNLISNALKFLKNDVPPVISITSRKLSEKEIKKHPALHTPHSPGSPDRMAVEGSYIEIIFKDNGIGFGQEFAEKIFIIFQRLNQNSEYQGTGIGLALAKKIAENHHGEIFAKAEINEGAAFHIILPVQQPM